MKCRPYQIKKCIFGIKIIDDLFQINLISWKETLVVYFKEKKRIRNLIIFLALFLIFQKWELKNNIHRTPFLNHIK